MLRAVLYINNKLIGELKAVNNKTGTLESGNYDYEILFEFREIKGKLNNHNRGHGAWELVRQILDKESMSGRMKYNE